MGPRIQSAHKDHRALIHDPGDGFSRADLKHAAVSNAPDDPTAHMQIRMAENLRPGGFGLLITSQLVDEVIYNQSGNEVILIKHLDEPDGTAPYIRWSAVGP